MQKKMVIVMLVLSSIFFLQAKSFSAMEKDVVSEFILALMKNEQSTAQTLLESKVTIPELGEATPIGGFLNLRSPEENKRVVVAHFQEEDYERIAFIWEFTTQNQTIKDIRVVYDGSNPFMNELQILKEYEHKMKRSVSVPSYFPFEVTSVDAEIKKKTLTIAYKNSHVHGVLKLHVTPKVEELKKLKGERDSIITLNNGSQALYQADLPDMHQLVFHHQNLQYTVAIGKQLKEQKITQNHLIQIAQSMVEVKNF